MEKYRKWIITVLFLVAFVPQIFKLLMPMGRMLPIFFPDDCFYYLKTALNIAAGKGSTFDGINFTNGYHPLWMLVCVVAAFFTSETIPYLYLMLVLNLLFTAVLSLRIMHLFKCSLGIWLALFVVVLMNCQRKCSGGLFACVESPLYIWLAVEVTNLLVSLSWRNAFQVLALGFLCGLAFLARTSFILYAPAMLIYLIYRWRKGLNRPSLKMVALMALPMVMLAVPYLAWNYYKMGFFQQISGITKNAIYPGGFASVTEFRLALLSIADNSGFVLRPLWLSLLFMLLAGICLFVLLRSRRMREIVSDERLVILLIFSAAEYMYYFVSYGRGTRLWHLAATMVVLYVVLARVVNVAMSCLQGSPRLRLTLIGITVIIALGCFGQNFYYYAAFSHPPFEYDTAIWARDNLPPGATIGVWNAGMTGYFSEHPVVNLDGLINGRELYDYRKDGRGVYRYILDKRIQYIGDGYLNPPEPEQSIIKDRLTCVYRNDVTIMGPSNKPCAVSFRFWRVD